MQFFILQIDADRSRAVNHIMTLDLRRAQSVEIKQYRKVRSLAQNRLMWMWINEIAEYTGDDPDDIHEILKRSLLGTIHKEALGYSGEVSRSTTQLTTSEMTQYLERIEDTARVAMIKLTKPDDYKYAMYGEER